MRLRDLVEMSPLGLTAVTEAPGLDREIGSVTVTDLPDPSRYLRGGELVISGLVWLADQRRSVAEHCELFVGAVAKAGCVGLAAGDTTDAPLPAELLETCARHGLPLVHVPAYLAFADLTEWINKRISAERAGDAGELLARHRRLVAAGVQEGMAGVVRLIGQETGMACALVAATGELVAAYGEPPSAAARIAIARESLRSAGQPERSVEYRGRSYSVYTVHGRPGTAITDWYAVFEGDWRVWPRQRRDAARGAARLVDAERVRLTAGQRSLRRVGRELVMLAAEAAPAAETGPRLTVAGLDPARGLRAIAIATAGTVRIGRLTRVLVESAAAETPVPLAVFGPEAPGAAEAEAGASAGMAEGGPWHEAAYAVALCADPYPAAVAETARTDTGPTSTGAPNAVLPHFVPTDTVSANTGPTNEEAPGAGMPDAAMSDVRAPGPESLRARAPGPGAGAGTADPAGLANVLRDRLAALAPGLARDRVAVGLSDRFDQAAGLTGAIEEARLAMRLAMRRPGQLELAAHDELASHLVLLAHVPDDLRRGYRERLLGPLRRYDTRHHSQLEETLDHFLACSASWSRCSQEMHIHVNTLRYRIEKINRLTGRDLARLDHQVDFYLALRAR